MKILMGFILLRECSILASCVPSVPSLDTFGISKLSVRSLLLGRLQVNAIKMIFLLQVCEFIVPVRIVNSPKRWTPGWHFGAMPRTRLQRRSAVTLWRYVRSCLAERRTAVLFGVVFIRHRRCIAGFVSIPAVMSPRQRVLGSWNCDNKASSAAGSGLDA